MRLLEIAVHNYKSFRVSPTIRFTSGLNVIIGPNNVGKTALLEALGLRFSDVPHRSLAAKPTRSTVLAPHSAVDVAVDATADELFGFIRETGSTFYVAAKDGVQPPAQVGQVIEALRQGPVLKFAYNIHSGVHAARFAFESGDSGRSMQLRLNPDGAIDLTNPNHIGVAASDRLPQRLGIAFRDHLYAFRAERFALSESPIAASTELAPNAGNIAGVLNYLQSSNPRRFDKYQSFVRDIFPQIQQITVPPIGNVARILLWPLDPTTERDDLAVSLADSGTGIGQVLAILYVLLTSEQPRVILIDEPSSFLHPGALRKLLEILIAHPQHQYVITTHSPTALATSAPSTLITVRLENSESVIEPIAPDSTLQLRAVLAEVGARLSDVFGADSILWVEGQTEEECFPIIRAHTRGPEEHLTGAVILAVRETGDFSGRKAEATIQIYNRLSTGSALLPSAVGFLFDPETKTPTQQEDLRRTSGGRVHFLRRRMFENYLLHPQAIAAVINSISGFRPTIVTPEEIAAWLDAHRWDRQHFATTVTEPDRNDSTWAATVHGASLLSALFKDLSEQRVTYDKVKHGVQLTQWLCAHAVEALSEVGATIRDALNA